MNKPQAGCRFSASVHQPPGWALLLAWPLLFSLSGTGKSIWNSKTSSKTIYTEIRNDNHFPFTIKSCWFKIPEISSIFWSTQPPTFERKNLGITWWIFPGCFNKQTSIKKSRFIWWSWRLVIFKPKIDANIIISAFNPPFFGWIFLNFPSKFREKSPPTSRETDVLSKRRLGWKHWGPGSSCIGRCDFDL